MESHQEETDPRLCCKPALESGCTEVRVQTWDSLNHILPPPLTLKIRGKDGVSLQHMLVPVGAWGRFTLTAEGLMDLSAAGDI